MCCKLIKSINNPHSAGFLCDFFQDLSTPHSPHSLRGENLPSHRQFQMGSLEITFLFLDPSICICFSLLSKHLLFLSMNHYLLKNFIPTLMLHFRKIKYYVYILNVLESGCYSWLWTICLTSLNFSFSRCLAQSVTIPCRIAVRIV